MATLPLAVNTWACVLHTCQYVPSWMPFSEWIFRLKQCFSLGETRLRFLLLLKDLAAVETAWTFALQASSRCSYHMYFSKSRHIMIDQSKKSEGFCGASVYLRGRRFLWVQQYNGPGGRRIGRTGRAPWKLWQLSSHDKANNTKTLRSITTLIGWKFGNEVE